LASPRSSNSWYGIRRSAAAVEELSGLDERDVDELAGMAEIDRLDVQGARRR
jgi:hypothetical protein